jgi:hypothetical protein
VLVARREGFEPPTARSVAWCYASIWSAPDGSGLLTLDGLSIWSDPVGSRRIVWMINRMIKQGRQPANSRSASDAVVGALLHRARGARHRVRQHLGC